jgi:hypothetical protein
MSAVEIGASGPLWITFACQMSHAVADIHDGFEP